MPFDSNGEITSVGDGGEYELSASASSPMSVTDTLEFSAGIEAAGRYVCGNLSEESSCAGR